MKKLILASNNSHKIKEIQAILGNEYNVIGLKDLNKNIRIIENGKTYKENAFIKAREIAKYYDDYVLADDSGLEIFSLPDILGIYSARFLGEDTPYEERFKEIFKLLQDKKNKEARFICGLALVTPNKKEYYIEGEVKGKIGNVEGEEGFGYDPIFYPNGYTCSIACLSNKEKNEISHRGNAIRKLKELLKEIDRDD